MFWPRIGGGGGTPTGLVFNPSDKAATLVLGDGNHNASASGVTARHGARSASAKSAGKWFAVLQNRRYASGIEAGFDIGADEVLDAVSAGDFIGTANSGTTQPFAGTTEAVTVHGDGAAITVAAGSFWAFALDLAAGKLWLGAFDPWSTAVAWHNGGDPASGANPQYSGLPAGNYWFYAKITTSANSGEVHIPPSTVVPPPSGFAAW